MTKCEDCKCDCHCNVGEHSDMYGVCPCTACKHEECEACQQTKQKFAICIPKKKKNQVHVVK